METERLPAQEDSTQAAESIESRNTLPLRDCVLLPLVFFLAIAALLAFGEIAARAFYSQYGGSGSCEYRTPEGAKFRPFCETYGKLWEGPEFSVRHNACGYRTDESCTVRPSGALRVAVIGSSTARGIFVRYPDTFAALSSKFLSEKCQETVDFQNLGSEPENIDKTDQRMAEALRLKPSAIVMPFGSYDLIHMQETNAAVRPASVKPHASFANIIHQSRLFLVAEYFLYKDTSTQAAAFLRNGDTSDYVRIPLSTAWRRRIENLDLLLRRMTYKAEGSGVPIFIYYIPTRGQVALAKLASLVPEVDPYALGNALASVAAHNGVQFRDLTKDFGVSANFQSLYYVTDGHIRDGGHTILADALEHDLLSDPAFARCTRPQEEKLQ